MPGRSVGPWLKAAAKMAHFPPEDMTGAIVRCTRCLYGQLVRQRFAPPKRYPMPSASATGDRAAFNAAELGMKIVVGFEMLAAEWARNGNELPARPAEDVESESVAAEAGTELGAGTGAGAGAEGAVAAAAGAAEVAAAAAAAAAAATEEAASRKEPMGDSTWDAFKASLQRHGYFRANIPGSAEYRSLLAAAVAQYKTVGTRQPNCSPRHPPHCRP